MKKLLFAVSTISILYLLTTGTGFAQHVLPNQVGLYEFSDGSGSSGSWGNGTPETVYLVLTNPTDPQNGGTPYSTINAFECRLNFIPAGNLLLLGDTLPPDAENVGDNTDIGAGFLEYIVEIGTDYPVTNESVVLITFTFLHLSPGTIVVTLTPTSDPIIPGEMAFQSVPGEPQVMYPSSGSHDDPVWIWQGGMAVESETFGSVKALYQ